MNALDYWLLDQHLDSYPEPDEEDLRDSIEDDCALGLYVGEDD